MQKTLIRNAFIVAALAILFWWAFEFAKHDSVLRSILPFGDDPWDAVGSFAAILVALLALVSFVRSCFPHQVGTGAHPVYVLRTQVAVPFCILVTVAVEAVAMVRHLPLWAGKPGAIRLVCLQATVFVVALTALRVISANTLATRSLSREAIITSLAALAVLAVYPESLIAGLPGHLFTIVFADACLFAPVAALVRTWVPGLPSTAASPRPHAGRATVARLCIAVTVGCLIGLLAYLAEINEDPVRPAAARMLFIGSVFVGVGGSGLAVAYAFLGRLLGFNSVELPQQK